MFNINGTLRFKDDEAYKNFIAALEIAYAEGRLVPVDGVTSISTEVNHLGTKFPLEKHDNLIDVVVGPSIEPVLIPLIVDGKEINITLFRKDIKDKIILESEPNSVVSFHFIFASNENKHTINYKVQFKNAKNIKEIIDSFGLATALLTQMYKLDEVNSKEDELSSLYDIKEYFRCYQSFFKRLFAIEKTFELSFSPTLLDELSPEEQRDIDELYLLLCEKQIVRLNAKITSNNAASITINSTANNKPLNIGSKIVLTFLSTIEFSFLKQTLVLHTANFMINALVKDIQENEDGTIKVLYGDTDSKPMYVSFTAFKTEEEARKELENIHQNEKLYIKAQTSNEYINQFYSSLNNDI